jgi:hypothetical protein
MAENKVSLDVEVTGVEQSINSVKDLKTALKAARDEQIATASKFGESSKEYIAASKNVSNLKDKVDDLNDSSKSLAGTGIERASQGFSQLGEGLRNLDLDKVKVGFTALKSAMAATGIMLIVQGVIYLIENFDELSKGSGILAKALRFVGDIITSVKDIIYEFTDAIGLTNTALDKLGDSTVENATKAKEALANQTAEYDRQIAIAKASGKSAVDLEKAKQQAIIDTNKALVEQTIEYVRQGGILDEEKKKALTEQLNAIKNARVQQEVIDITENTKELDRFKKLQDDKIKAEQDAWNKTVEIRIANSEAQKAEDKRLADEKAAQDQLDKQAQLDYINSVANDEKAVFDNTYDYKKAKRDEELNDFKNNQEQQLAAARSALQSTQQITDLFFAYKLNKHKNDAKAEREIRKKQFQVNKAFGISMSVIDGIGAITKALNNPYPLNIILAIAAGVAATASTLKIASTKFDDGGGGASDAGGGGAASVPIPTPPTINTPNANTNSTTSFDENGKRLDSGEKSIQPTINVKATVGVDEITDKSNRVQVLEKQSTF